MKRIALSLCLASAACAELDAAGTEASEELETAGVELAGSTMALSELARGGVAEGEASTISLFSVNAPASVTTSFETRSCTEGVDPVLHLLKTGMVGVAVDDNSGEGSNARLSVTPAAGTSSAYSVLLRSANGMLGTCRIFKNGQDVGSASVGGFFVKMTNLRDNEVIETVRTPGQSGLSHTLYMLDQNGIGVEEVIRNGGTGVGARKQFTQAMGTRSFLLSVSGTGRVVRNDVSVTGDRDQDGLGDELEQSLGTCSDLVSTTPGFHCGFATDARDTDGDGLTDFWEVLGRRDVTPHQTLPAWGSNPRHKDMFAEVDFMQRTGPSEADRMLTAANARQIAAAYASTDMTRGSESRLRILRGARNPDGQPGIALHFDTGVSPTDEADQTLFGNWGGHSIVPPVLQDDGTYKGMTSGAAWSTHMTTARHGLFHYLLGYPGDGGQCSENVMHCAIPLDGPGTAIHEMSHTLGSGHSGPTAGDTADPNCKPNYLSTNNYGYIRKVGFHDGSGPVLNNVKLDERTLEGVSPFLLERLATDFLYNVDAENGFVDWNRNGVFDTGLVRDYANYTPLEGGGGCEFTGGAKHDVATAKSRKAPALVALGTKLGVFHVALNGRLAFALSANAISACADEPAGLCPDAAWTVTSNLSTETLAAVDAAVVTDSGSPYVLVTTVTTSGRLDVRWFSAANNGDDVDQGSQNVTLGSDVSPEATSLTVDADGQAWLAYLGATDRRVRVRRYAQGQWTAAAEALNETGQPIVAGTNGAPTLSFTRVPGSGADSFADYIEGIYLAVPEDANNTLRIYLRDTASGRFGAVSSWETSAPTNVRGKVSLDYLPGAAGRSPRTYLHYRTANATREDGDMMRMISHAKGTGPDARHVLGLKGHFHNTWLDSFGQDTLFRPGVDSNLRYVASLDINDKLEFRPHADGIVDHALLPWNDFETLAISLCLTTTKGSDANPVNCAPWKWGQGHYGGIVRAASNPEYCVHKNADGFGNGNILHLWKCSSGGAANKHWRYEHKTGYIRAEGNMNVCWHKERADWQEGQAIHLWECDAGQAQQKTWQLDPVTQQIRSRARPDMCIVKENETWANGVDLQLKSCASASTAAKSLTF